MFQKSANTLRKHLESMDTETWNSLDRYHLAEFKAFLNFSFDTKLLHAASECWSTKHHIFCFNGVELCPLFEEFEGILGKPYRSNAPLPLPYAFNQTPESLSGFFGVTLGQILPCMEGPFLLTLPLLELGSSKPKNCKFWQRITSFCLYAHFLLVSTEGRGSIQIAHVVEQVESGHNPFPIILAETIIGLDSMKHTRRLRGSPLLLQVCISFTSHACFHGSKLIHLVTSDMDEGKVRCTDAPSKPYYL